MYSCQRNSVNFTFLMWKLKKESILKKFKTKEINMNIATLKTDVCIISAKCLFKV